MGNGAVLETRGLTRRFGGLVALDCVDFTMRAGELRAIIGPNGAGKTTFFNLVRGRLVPTGGDIYFRGQRITGVSPHAASHLGIASTLQITSVFANLTVWENVLAAAQSRKRFGQLLSPFARFADREARAEEVLALVGLLDRAGEPANNLSHGEQRLLEIGIALATDPLLLLLDEPTAGMGGQETQLTVETIKKLSRSVEILLVEHDMDVVMGLAHRITVFDQGRIIAEGTPAEIQANPEVQAVYLGTASLRSGGGRFSAGFA